MWMNHRIAWRRVAFQLNSKEIKREVSAISRISDVDQYRVIAVAQIRSLKEHLAGEHLPVLQRRYRRLCSYVSAIPVDREFSGDVSCAARDHSVHGDLRPLANEF